MHAREQRRLEVLTRLIGGRITQEQAAALLGCSPRTVRRLRARLEREGAAGLCHGNRGRAPQHKTAPEVLERLRPLLSEGGPYQHLNTCHLCEILREREGITLSRSTLDRLLREAGLRPARRGRQRRVFARREPMAAAGMLVQIDASPHDWLQGRGPRLTLVGAVDDATGAVLYARFHPSESQDAYLCLLRQTALDYGLPMSLYHDKHTILRSPKQATLEDELAGREPRSQFQRVLSVLGVEGIAAHSPQAKGRIERLWQTLQDRLVRELALAGASTQETANAFLPDFLARFNARFSRQPRQPEPAFVPWEAGADLGYYFSTVETRVLRADQTLAFAGRVLQLERGSARPSGTRLNVHTTPEGEVLVYDGPTRLPYRQVTPRPVGSTPAKAEIGKAPPPVPAPDPAAQAQARARKRAWLYGAQS